MFCVIGTEEETGGDGAGEVSTGLESENLVRRRRAVVTSLVFPRPIRTRVGVAIYWREHLIMVYFVPKQ